MGLLGYELKDFSVVTSGDLAFCHGFVRISGTKVDEDQKVSVWVRQTLCLGKPGGMWKIWHEHTSVPLDMDGSLEGRRRSEAIAERDGGGGRRWIQETRRIRRCSPSSTG